MTDKEFPFADIKHTKKKRKKLPEMPFFSIISQEKKKKSPYNGLVSAIYFTSIHSDSVLSCVVPLKTTITSQLNPFCIYSCICCMQALHNTVIVGTKKNSLCLVLI